MTKTKARKRYRLFLPRSIWDKGYGEFENGGRQAAWGFVQRNHHTSFLDQDDERVTVDYCDLVVHRMQFVEDSIDEIEPGPHSDWILFCKSRLTEQFDLQRLAEKVQLSENQYLVYLQVGLNDDASGWIGFVQTQEHLYPLEAIHFVGACMPVIRKRPGRIPTLDSSKWSRQMGALGTQTFQRMLDLRVILVGAGRLGSLMAECLIRCGIRNLIVVDPDVVESHNLNATFSANDLDVGRSKVEALLNHLHLIRPDALLKGIPDDDISRVFEQARSTDLLITCVDNDEIRETAAITARRLLNVHLDLGTLVSRHSEEHTADPFDYDREIGADIHLHLPGSCVMCVRGIEAVDENEEESNASSSEVSADWRDGGRTGSLCSINLIAVGIAMQLLFDLLGGKIKTSYWCRLQWNQGDGIESVAGSIKSPGHCRICGS